VIQKNICYWCGKEANSKEHVPPKCLFPEDKDIFPVYGKSYRKNLITVPSCTKHNTEKSGDDEYLMTCISSIVGNNELAYIHTATKVKRTRMRNQQIVNVLKDSILDIGFMKFPVQFIKVNCLRLAYSFEAMARALFFYEFNCIVTGRCIVISKIFSNDDDSYESKYQTRSAKLLTDESKTWGTNVKGVNPEIFTYQVSPLFYPGIKVFKLIFYKNVEVYVIVSTLDSATEKQLEKWKPRAKQILFGTEI